MANTAVSRIQNIMHKYLIFNIDVQFYESQRIYDTFWYNIYLLLNYKKANMFT